MVSLYGLFIIHYSLNYQIKYDTLQKQQKAENGDGCPEGYHDLIGMEGLIFSGGDDQVKGKDYRIDKEKGKPYLLVEEMIYQITSALYHRVSYHYCYADAEHQLEDGGFHAEMVQVRGRIDDGVKAVGHI